ncbi:MAG: 1-(5-phosphoribosyl)-5-[(5-phosphoribosylamino)methylideneamino]imidazole-4-carboxamide isomerase [Eubacteriales bacterium]
MFVYPAIDLYQGAAVRLTHGDYSDMTVYSSEPLSVARFFAQCGAKKLHIVDLEGARDGGTANFKTISEILRAVPLKAEVGGGIRSAIAIEKYLDAGAERVILGTAAITKPDFLRECARIFGDRIAVGVDVRGGKVAIRGWTETSGRECFDFCRELEDIGIRTVICTDIAKDGALGGTNRELYARLRASLHMNIIASGGITTTDDLRALSSLNLYGAIVGRVLYTGAMRLRDALAAAGDTE